MAFQNSDVTTLLDAVANGVAASRIVDPANSRQVHRALEIMRHEVRALMFGAEYADERACVAAGTVSPKTVLLAVVASCVLKIKAAPA